MKVKNIIFEDFCNYKKPCMFISFTKCSFKCEKDYGDNICQNKELFKSKDIELNVEIIVNKYIENPITSSIVCGGLEPFDTFEDIIELLDCFRKKSNDDFVIYTGYEIFEIKDMVDKLSEFENVIIKFGRFIPDSEYIYNELLGIELASKNQYALKIS